MAGLNLANSGWGQMDTSLKCGEDQMKLKALGPGSSYFMLDMGMLNSAYDVCHVVYYRSYLCLNILFLYFI